MGNVHEITERKRLDTLERIQESLHKGGEPPYDGGMEARVAKLENIAEKTGERLNSIEKNILVITEKLNSITTHYATKSDLSDAKNSIIMWVVSAIFLAQLLPAILKKFGL